MTYQPVINADLLTKININSYTDDARQSVKRYLAIRAFLKDWEDKNVLDIGSSEGFFSILLAIRGANCYGIENDTAFNTKRVEESQINIAINQGNYYKLKNCYFYNRDIVDFAENNEEDFDVSLVLSVIHNLVMPEFNNYSTETAKRCLLNIWEHTREVMFFENDEKNFNIDFSEFKNCEEIVELGKFESYNGERKMYALVKTSKPKNKYRKYRLRYTNNTGTESRFIEDNIVKLEKIFNFKPYRGSINLISENPIPLKHVLFNVELDYSECKYNLAKVTLNGVKGYLTQTRWDMYEFFTSEEVALSDVMELEVEE